MSQTFPWTPRFETGLAEVDHQHRQLVALINALGEQVREDLDVRRDDIAALYRELRDYAVYHFAEEERLMAEEGLDGGYVEQHRAQHRYYLEEVERLYGRLSAEAGAEIQSILKFLTSWLVYHILGTDQAMARQMERIHGGMSPREALLAEEDDEQGATEPLLAALHGLFEQVAQRNRELQALNEGLEQRVAARTEELAGLVARLEQEKAQSQRLGEALAVANRHLEDLANTDVLTGLPNRRHAMAQLERLWREADGALAVIMIDADDFKPVNDAYGHDAGDEVLKRVAERLRHAVRSDDLVCRMGGDEFLIICPHTSPAGAEQVAAKAWDLINSLRVAVGDGEWRGSISVGVAHRQGGAKDLAELIKDADEAVYAAKRAGRNCIRVSPRGLQPGLADPDATDSIGL